LQQPEQAPKMNKRLAFRFLFLLGITCLVCLFLYYFWPVFIPFLFSYIFVFALKPAVLFLERLGRSYRSAVIIVFAGFICVVSLLFVVIIPLLYSEIIDISGKLPLYQELLVNRLSALQLLIQSKLDFLSTTLHINVIGESSLFGQNYLDNIWRFMDTLPKIIFGLIPLAINILIIPFATFLLLFDESSLKKNLISIVPNRYFEVTLNLFYNLNRQFGMLLRGMLTTTLLVSLLSFFGLWLIGIPYPLMVGIFAGVANLIPYVGPVVGIVAASLIALMTGLSGIHYALIILVFIIVNLIENVFILPVVMARAANLHPLFVIFLVLLGSRLGGVFGMLLALPAASLMFVFIRIMYNELSRPARPPFSSYSMRKD
jgi:putative permease